MCLTGYQHAGIPTSHGKRNHILNREVSGPLSSSPYAFFWLERQHRRRTQVCWLLARKTTPTQNSNPTSNDTLNLASTMAVSCGEVAWLSHLQEGRELSRTSQRKPGNLNITLMTSIFALTLEYTTLPTWRALTQSPTGTLDSGMPSTATIQALGLPTFQSDSSPTMLLPSSARIQPPPLVPAHPTCPHYQPSRGNSNQSPKLQYTDLSELLPDQLHSSTSTMH